ncbi:hypothetical protein FHS27_004742 [Rhodopirellula rubra]|uniref:Uncharacterized protein n=1 Tax=Aporhodopirellula rubra TaxID=980271 RepID=A0A7W5E2B5_9BACT|nr:hypothetical protein [Aporhodopirellula rubra]MBB3208908.1 hypothetical protein [Aporhodopirellula rubra]
MQISPPVTPPTEVVVYYLTETQMQAVKNEAAASMGMEVFFFMSLVVLAVIGLVGTLASREGYMKAKKEIEEAKTRKKERPNCLLCQCGERATHFVNVNGVDQPVCATHAQEVLLNV